MNTDHFDLIVIGAGSGGIAGAIRAARLGARVAVLEPSALGGTCVNVGCVPKKAMWLAAELAEAQTLAAELGFASKPGALDWSGYIERREHYIRNIHASYRQRFEGLAITVIPERGHLLGGGRIGTDTHTETPMPLLVYHHGAGGTVEENSILMEYLASHGYVVASVVSLSTDDLPVAGGAGLDEVIRDTDVLIRALHREPWVDRTRLAMLGHSLGAQLSLIYTAGNPAVDATVGLDTTWDYPANQERIISRMGYQRWAQGAAQVVTPLLGFASSGANYKPYDMAGRAWRYLVTLEDFDHDDFVSQRAVAARRPADAGVAPDAKAATYLARYEQLCEITRSFLDATLRGRAEDRTNLRRLLAPDPAATGVTCQERPATLPPPHLRDLRDLLVDRGITAVIELCEQRKTPDAGCPDGWMAALADGLLEEQRIEPAVTLLDAHVKAHPDDVYFLLLLADTLVLHGDRDRARAHYERVLQLQPKLDKPPEKLSMDEVYTQHYRGEAERGLARLDGKDPVLP